MGALLLAAAVLAALLAPAGCGGKSISQEEALESVRSAYRAMAECSGYRFRSNVSYDFPRHGRGDQSPGLLHPHPPVHGG